MSSLKRKTEASERFAERRRREEEAPRVLERVPNLQSLELRVEESQDSTILGSNYKKLIVVERAPALFVIPCGDSSCSGGGYDITRAVMWKLQEGAEEFEVEDRCHGSVSAAACRRGVRVIARATYRST